jgi:hypothetical protein
MPTLQPTWRNETSVSCWLCEHFQRYDQASNPVECWGECRKNIPACYAEREGFQQQIAPDPVVDMPPFIIYGFGPWIPFANMAWCSGFQRSTVAVPPAPATIGDCAPQFPPLTPWVFNGAFVEMPWTKVPITASCWYCKAFQRLFQTKPPGPPYPSAMCAGYCCHEPPRGFEALYESEFPYEIPSEATFFPLVLYGPLYWCSKWEKNDQPVPDPFLNEFSQVCQGQIAAP